MEMVARAAAAAIPEIQRPAGQRGHAGVDPQPDGVDPPEHLGPPGRVRHLEHDDALHGQARCNPEARGHLGATHGQNR